MVFTLFSAVDLPNITNDSGSSINVTLIGQLFLFLTTVAGFMYQSYSNAKKRQWEVEDADRKEKREIALADTLAKKTEEQAKLVAQELETKAKAIEDALAVKAKEIERKLLESNKATEAIVRHVGANVSNIVSLKSEEQKLDRADVKKAIEVNTELTRQAEQHPVIELPKVLDVHVINTSEESIPVTTDRDKPPLVQTEEKKNSESTDAK